MQYLIRFAQAHETFRRPELEALSKYENIACEIIEYSQDSPFCLITLNDVPCSLSPSSTVASSNHSDQVVKRFISRSILARGMYEVWGTGLDYDKLHADVRSRSQHLWKRYEHARFKFSIDAYYSKRSAAEQREIITSFNYLGFLGKVDMKHPEAEFVIFEEWDHIGGIAPQKQERDQRQPKRLFLGRLVGRSRRDLIDKHDLKKRPYISTTSMDAELALVTAELALAGPGKLFLDPFVGTGGFMVAASELGALSMGSDIDGRSYRGKGKGLSKGVGSNFDKYGLQSRFGDCVTSDLTNTPFRTGARTLARSSGRNPGEKQGKRVRTEGAGRWLDGIVCDPPYGVREGLRVLGTRETVPNNTGISMNVAEGTETVPQATMSDNQDVLASHSNNTQEQTVQNPTTSSSQASRAQSIDPPLNTRLEPRIEPNQKQKRNRTPIIIDGMPSYKSADYIAPKKPYSFDSMLLDILDFASRTLVDGGRLAFWMPVAPDIPSASPSPSQSQPQIPADQKAKEKEESQKERTKVKIPTHPTLKHIHTCIQDFNKWSRWLLIYERIPSPTTTTTTTTTTTSSLSSPFNDNTTEPPNQIDNGTQIRKGNKADDLNEFRRRYFQGFS